MVAVDGAVLDFLLRHADTLFRGPDRLRRRDASKIEGKTVAGDLTGVLLKRTLSATLELPCDSCPTRGTLRVGSASTFDRHWRLSFGDLQPFEGRVGITYLFGLSMDETLTRLSRLPAHSVILYTTVFSDGAGRSFMRHEALSWIAASVNAPVYGTLDQYVGLATVGGNVTAPKRTEPTSRSSACSPSRRIAGAPPGPRTEGQVDLFDPASSNAGNWTRHVRRGAPYASKNFGEGATAGTYRVDRRDGEQGCDHRGLPGARWARQGADRSGGSGTISSCGYYSTASLRQGLAGPRDQPAAHCDPDERTGRERLLRSGRPPRTGRTSEKR